MLALAKRPEALSLPTQVQIGSTQLTKPTFANGRHLRGRCAITSGARTRVANRKTGTTALGWDLPEFRSMLFFCLFYSSHYGNQYLIR